MLCGGCGSKVGNVILESSLKKLSSTRSGHIVSEIGDDAAVVKINSTFQALTTDHLRSFTNDVWLQSKITAIHALGDIWAMGSDPEVALTNIIIPESSNDIQKRTIEEIIDGANSVFAAEGVKIVGGHTTLGKEIVIGFTLGGFSEKRPKTVDKARAGDQIILTKPLGSGVLLAGEMRFEGEGQDLKNLFDEMSKSQSSIAKVLSKVANSMTDVTGFGLAGHLLNIISKSNVGAKLILDKIPVYAGVNNLVAKDIRSSIFENNYMYSERMFVKANANIDILFDPQTSGPLLATVPKGKVKGVIGAGEKLGFECKVIGELTNGRPFIEVL
jgi:selenide,water dikinase